MSQGGKGTWHRARKCALRQGGVKGVSVLGEENPREESEKKTGKRSSKVYQEEKIIPADLKRTASENKVAGKRKGSCAGGLTSAAPLSKKQLNDLGIRHRNKKK